MTWLLSIVVLLATCFTNRIVVADEPAATSENAALLYYQAAALIPEFTEDEKQLLIQISQKPFIELKLNKTSQKLIDRSSHSLGMMNRAAKIQECDWGIQWEDGISALLPHIAKSRTLIRLSVLRARHRLDDELGDSPKPQQEKKENDLAAVKDFLAALQLTRQVGRDDILISHIFQNSMENFIFESISDYLFQLDPEAQRFLLKGLDEIPDPSGLDIAILREKDVFVGSLKRKLSGEQAEHEYSVFLQSFNQNEKELIQQKAPDAASLIELLDDLAEYYDEVVELTKLTPDEIGPRWKALIKRVQAENIIASLMLPAIKKARILDAKSIIRRNMLKAAVRLSLKQETEFLQIRDSFGEGPFEHRKDNNRVILTSRLTIEGKNFEAQFLTKN